MEKSKFLLFSCLVVFLLILGEICFLTMMFIVGVKAVETVVDSSPTTSISFFENIKKENYDKAIDRLADKIILDLPDDIHMRLLAIPEVEDDDGAFVDTLTNKIKEKTRYRLIERKDLNKLLTEQGIQLNPMTDARESVEPGRIKGVEALILGQFKIKSVSLFHCYIDMFVKMINVETGDIVFAKDVKAKFIQPIGVHLVSALLLLIVFLMMIRSLKNYKTARTRKFITKDDTAQLELADTLKKAGNNINRSHDSLVAADRIDLSAAVMDAGNHLRALIKKAEQTPGYSMAALEKGSKSEILKSVKSQRGLIKNIYAESEKLYTVVKKQNHEKVPGVVLDLKQEIKNYTNGFKARTAGKL